jgi:stress 70 chaperone-associated protein
MINLHFLYSSPGGGTMDVSILWLNNAVFVTQAMAGNNRLGGQDFNERIQTMLLQVGL